MRTVASSPKVSFWTIAFVLTLALWTSGAPSILYPLYIDRWHLNPLTTTAIFATYIVALEVMLLLLGNISDYIGRRASVLIGLSLLIAGTLLFAVAPSVGWVFVGRFIQGFGVGFIVGAGGAALADYNPYRSTLPGPLNTATQAVGLTLATMVGAFLVTYGPSPLHLAYWVLDALLVVALILTTALPRQSARSTPNLTGWRPPGFHTPRGNARAYSVAASALSSGLGIAAIYLALGSQISHDLIAGANLIVSAATLSLSFALIAVGAWISIKVSPGRSIIAGAILGVVSVAALTAASGTRSLAVFLAASGLAGVAVGLLISGAIAVTIAAASARHRAGLLSSSFLVAYLVQAAVALGGGAIATATGVGVATDWVAAAVALICVAAAVLAVAARRSGRRGGESE